jgi:hypothetical protein
MRILEGADHTLTSRWAKGQLGERIEEYLKGNFEC